MQAFLKKDIEGVVIYLFLPIFCPDGTKWNWPLAEALQATLPREFDGIREPHPSGTAGTPAGG